MTVYSLNLCKISVMICSTYSTIAIHLENYWENLEINLLEKKKL